MAYRIGECLLSDKLREINMPKSVLAAKLGVSRQQVYKWTSGKQKMSMETAKNVAFILELNSSEDLYEWIVI